MPISIFKIFMVFGIVSSWAARALQDGKITLVEAADLAMQLGAALGIPTELAVPEPAAPVNEVVEELPLQMRPQAERAMDHYRSNNE